MTTQLKLLMVLAHPDDESLGNGGMLAKYAAQGIETYLVTATRGEQGWFFDPEDYPGPDALGKIRERELQSAARLLGLKEVNFLGYRDGDLDKADPGEVIEKIAGHIRRIQPHVVVTFDQNGLYGHPDHIAICSLTTAAVAAAGDPAYQDRAGQARHSVAKLYYMAWTQQEIDTYSEGFDDIVMNIDGEERRPVPWPEWAITTRIDATGYYRAAWKAVSCHRTQLPGYQGLLELPEENHVQMWGTYSYYRVFTRVPVPSGIETDLFEGLRVDRHAEGHLEAAALQEEPHKADHENASEIHHLTALVVVQQGGQG